MRKRYLTLLLKIAVSAALVYLVFRKVNWGMCGDQMAVAFRRGYGWLLAALAFVVMIFSTTAVRWKTILAGHDVNIGFLEAFRLLLVGFFFAQFMPGGLAAGDVVRSYYIASRTDEKKLEAVASVVLDRVIGSLGLVTLMVVSLIVAGEYLLRCLMLAGIAAALGLGAILFFSKDFVTKLPFADWIYRHLPYRDSLARAYEAFRHYREHKAQLVFCWWQSVFIQFMLVVVAYCVGRSVGVSATPSQYLVWIPLVGAISSLPVSFGSIGTAEAAYRLFFLRSVPLAGVRGKHSADYESVVLAFALMMRILWLFVGVVGGIIWWVEKGAITRNLVRQQGGCSDPCEGNASKDVFPPLRRGNA